MKVIKCCRHKRSFVAAIQFGPRLVSAVELARVAPQQRCKIHCQTRCRSLTEKIILWRIAPRHVNHGGRLSAPRGGLPPPADPCRLDTRQIAIHKLEMSTSAHFARSGGAGGSGGVAGSSPTARLSHAHAHTAARKFAKRLLYDDSLDPGEFSVRA